MSAPDSAAEAEKVVVSLGYGGATLSHPSWSCWLTSERGDLELYAGVELVCTVPAGEWSRVFWKDREPRLTEPDLVQMNRGWQMPTDQGSTWSPFAGQVEP